MTHPQKENAAPTAMGNGVKLSIEATKLQLKHTPKDCIGAIYFWNRASHSVEPLKARLGEDLV
jgi:hypothetical protein